MARVLFLNPSVGKYGRTPIGITSYSGLLKKNNHAVRLFDTTFFDTNDLFNLMSKSTGEKPEEYGFYQEVNLQRYGVKQEKVDVIQELNNVLESFKPDIVALSIWSCMLTGEDEYRMLERGLLLLDQCHRGDYLVVVGGVLPSLKPEEAIENPLVDIVCVGEGEYAFLELADKIDTDREGIEQIQNLWVKGRGEIHKNSLRPLIENLDELPAPDFQIFDDRVFYRPYHGEVVRGIDYEFSRGCYYNCSYCVSPALRRLYNGKKEYRRERSAEKLINDLSFVKAKYDLQVVKFLDELFLDMSEEKLKILSQEYSRKVGLPFMIETTINSITEQRLKYLKEMGCLSISLGVESGNDEFRREVLKKNIDSKQIIEKIHLLNKYEIDYSLFTIIGLPFETRKMIFDAIKLYKKTKAKCISCSYFQPFVGAELTKICLEKGYLKEGLIYSSTENSSLELPQISKKELLGLMKTFMFYIYYPKILYPFIRILEKNNGLSRLIYPLLKRYVSYKLKKNQNRYSDVVKRRKNNG